MKTAEKHYSYTHSASELAIEISSLNKTYKASGKSPAKVALRDVDLKIPRGSIYGLLGPNGAGKSTIINIMAGLVMKTSGRVKIWGHDLDTRTRKAKSAIGIVPQEINFDPFFTPREMLDIQAGLYGVPASRRRTDELLELVGLQDKANAYARSLSGGMRRRLMVAKAMVHDPPILVLDEPTAGVDIELRQQLWSKVRDLNSKGVTVLLTTHYLEEAEELCDRIAIINHGNIIADEEKETLLSQIDAKSISFRFEQPFTDIPDGLEEFSPEKQGKRTLVLKYSPGETQIGKVIETLTRSGHVINDISTDESDLEDVFLQLTRQDNA